MLMRSMRTMPNRHKTKEARKEPRTSYVQNDSSDSDEEDTKVVRVLKNTIYYRGAIEEPHATDFCIALTKLTDELWSSDGVIYVRVTSGGGSVFAGICMYEAVRECGRNVRVKVIAEGYCASAATFVMLGAKERAMYSTTVLLVHAISTWIGRRQKPKDLQEELTNCETLMSIVSDMYKNNTQIADKDLKKLFETDVYMKAEECMRHGFVHEIL